MTMEPFAVRRVHIPVDGIDPAAMAPAPQQTVLLVTGDNDLRVVAARALARDGYRVVTAAHSGHALLACFTSGRIDLVAAELSMEEMSGPALTERLRRHHPELGAVYFAEAGTAECEGVLVRPFTRDELLLQLATCAASIATPVS